MKDTTTRVSLLKQSRASFLRQFGRDEDGSIIVMTLLLLIVMLVLGGMAVDFMRFESRRAMLQSVADRAVLAAAELDQTMDSSAVVVDFFDKAGYDGAIIGTPTVDNTGSSRSVAVNSEIDVNTFYLRLIGIDTLTAPARSSAVEGTGNVEVSLILDISGSMGNWVASQSTTKMELLRAAAKDFVDDLLLDEYDDRISINLVAYSQHVAIGDEIYKALRTTPDTITESGVEISSYVTVDEPLFDDDGTALPDHGTDVALDPGLGNTFTNPSRCVDFLPAEYSQLAFNTARVYEQVEYFQHYDDDWQNMNRPVCPDQGFEGIIPMSQDPDALKDAIDLYRPTTFTSIHLGMKWGVSLLDPSMRDLLGGIGSIDDVFRDSRPADYGDTNTVKYIVLMTDGENVRGRRVEDEHYDTYEWRATWSEYPMDYWRWNISSTSYGRDDLTDFPTTAALHDQWMQSMCDLADDYITIFTIAMGSTSHGEGEMLECASQPSFAFNTDLTSADGEPGIDEIFDKIAKQITALRLNL
ncbi:TadE/TadG family type IV pilus assembly protein [Loktanella sp. Alg231-35]|uniref:TadE/TadG family type IV pilus assembly protein n=1 Tax=Loktanella sp. Alg231-35 TaxID=1922220 RepID=UPI00131F1C2F|nr:pilus assembly protein TadG-related protein [Loktanella sp. Alg231-35]